MSSATVKKWYDLASWKDTSRCPMCNSKLTKRWEGLVCNKNCPLNFKLGKGWVYLTKKKESSHKFFKDKYDFDIERLENKKKWLILKSRKLYSNPLCEICGCNHGLNIHHILQRSKYPELTLDIENLMTLCIKCHKKIHSNDKYRFGGKDETS